MCMHVSQEDRRLLEMENGGGEEDDSEDEFGDEKETLPSVRACVYVRVCVFACLRACIVHLSAYRPQVAGWLA